MIDAELIPPLVAMLGEAEFDIKKEAAWAISNATSGGRRAPCMSTRQQLASLLGAQLPLSMGILRGSLATSRACPGLLHDS